MFAEYHGNIHGNTHGKARGNPRGHAHGNTRGKARGKVRGEDPGAKPRARINGGNIVANEARLGFSVYIKQLRFGEASAESTKNKA